MRRRAPSPGRPAAQRRSPLRHPPTAPVGTAPSTAAGRIPQKSYIGLAEGVMHLTYRPPKASSPTDRPALDNAEVEITPEMEEAGLSAVLAFAREGSFFGAASEIYRAMENVRRRS